MKQSPHPGLRSAHIPIRTSFFPSTRLVRPSTVDTAFLFCLVPWGGKRKDENDLQARGLAQFQRCRNWEDVTIIRGSTAHNPPPTISKNMNLSISSGISACRRLLDEHSRRNSQSSVVASSSLSTTLSPSVPSPCPMQDPPLSSSTLLDNNPVHAMKAKVDIASSILESMEGLVGGVSHIRGIDQRESVG